MRSATRRVLPCETETQTISDFMALPPVLPLRPGVGVDVSMLRRRLAAGKGAKAPWPRALVTPSPRGSGRSFPAPEHRPVHGWGSFRCGAVAARSCLPSGTGDSDRYRGRGSARSGREVFRASVRERLGKGSAAPGPAGGAQAVALHAAGRPSKSEGQKGKQKIGPAAGGRSAAPQALPLSSVGRGAGGPTAKYRGCVVLGAG